MPLGFIPRPRLRIPGKAFVRRRWNRRRHYAQHAGSDDHHKRPPLYRRLANAWYDTPTKWYPLHIGIGSLLLVSLHWRKRRQQQQGLEDTRSTGTHPGVRLKGPWQVHVLGALPLRSASRLWGYVNSFELPVWFRPYGFGFYSWLFGCNLQELEEPDLKKYRSLGDFFYRKLRADARPIDPALLVSPADGTVLHFGSIQGHAGFDQEGGMFDRKVEQVKGMTYSLDALLGLSAGNATPTSQEIHFANRDHAHVDDSEFANVNGIEYSVDQLLGHSALPAESESSTPGTPGTPISESPPNSPRSPFFPGNSQKDDKNKDASVGNAITATDETNVDMTMSDAASLALQTGVRPLLQRSVSQSAVNKIQDGNELFFAVVYLAPGDYHRFHSPSAWVVEKRRHFAGELYSVSPYIAKRLEGLFVLNERVALLGRWRHGFFSMIPVGATNVGSIIVNFDKDLRTNAPRRHNPPPGFYREAVYTQASPLLGGQPLKHGVEMGGFKLGSTIVLVFEAPKEFQFEIKAGQKVKVGQAFGNVPEVNMPTGMAIPGLGMPSKSTI